MRMATGGVLELNGGGVNQYFSFCWFPCGLIRSFGQLAREETCLRSGMAKEELVISTRFFSETLIHTEALAAV